MNNVSLDEDGAYVTVNKLEITRYEKKVENRSMDRKQPDIFKVVMKSKIGSPENFFTFTIKDFGEDAEEVEKALFNRLKQDSGEMKSVPSKIFERHIYTGEYVVKDSWEEEQDERIRLYSKEIIPLEEQAKKIRKHFLNEFGLDVEYFLTVKSEISSSSHYFENLETVEDRVRDLYSDDYQHFRDSMTDDGFRRFTTWIDNYYIEHSEYG